MRGGGAHQAELTQSWTRYWRAGNLTSCSGGPDGDARLAESWRTFFAGLSPGARILDLATGNGAVARCAAECDGLRVTGIDAADIDPLAHVSTDSPLREVLFIGGVWIEQLPFAEAAFDAVCSQFGFEYAEEAPAARELARVTAPGGRIRLVLHAREGAVWRDIGARAAQLHAALFGDGAISLMHTAIADDAAPIPDEAIEHAAARHLAHAATAPPDDAAIFYVGGLLQLWRRRAHYAPAGLRLAFNDAMTRARAVLLRQEALLEAARDPEGMDALCARLRDDLGLDIGEAEPIWDASGEQMAWLVDARKPAP